VRKIMSTVLALAAGISVAACTADTRPTDSKTTTTTTTEPTARGAPATQSTPPTPSTPTSEPPDRTEADSLTGCQETRNWNTAQESASAYSTDALYLVRAGQHDCYDRVVLDVNGPNEVGYLVRYVPVVTADGSGDPVPVAGGAALAVIVHTPPLGFDSGGHQPGRVFANTGDDLYTAAQLDGWRSLRAVRFAGYFEGQSTLAIGVRDELPFRVFTQLDPTSRIRRIVIDIAHNR
jgi:hypothetical protein